jgi:hypothetical protein
VNVRSASFRDLGRIEQLHRAAAEQEGVGAAAALPSVDSPVPQTALVRLWYGVSKTLSALVPITDSDTSLLVAEDSEGTVTGFIQAQGVPGQPKAWHITNLCVEPTARGHFSTAPLLTALCHTGIEHGVTRFVVGVPVDHSLLPLFIEQGFTQYATEQILFRDDSASTPRMAASDVPAPLRVARRADVGAIHLLYLRTTPSHVAAVEGPTLKAWQAAFHNGSMARFGRDDTRHLVCERPGIVAWAGIRPGSGLRPSLLALMCDGQDTALREEVIDAVLAALPPGPCSCVLRHYDSELIRALQRRGFEIYGSQLLLVRDIAVKVKVPELSRDKKKKPVLAYPGLARTVVLQPAPFTVSRSSTSSSR